MPAKVKSKKSVSDKQNILLKAFEALGESYSLGYDAQNFYDELKFLETEAEEYAESIGQVNNKEKAIRDTVNQFRKVDEIINKYKNKNSALIQILLDIQNEFNWLPKHILHWVSARVAIPISKIYTIANFYEVLNLEPVGEHIIQVCQGTACHVRGSSELMQRVSAILGIEPGETDAEQVFTLKSVHCLGCCALAPVIKVDEQYYGNPSMENLKEIFDSCREEEMAA